jgi:hypothetical protein
LPGEAFAGKKRIYTKNAKDAKKEKYPQESAEGARRESTDGSSVAAVNACLP